VPDKYVLGIDFGSDSARAIIVDVLTGDQVGEAEAIYNRWSDGKYSDDRNRMFRQHPLDYIEAISQCIRTAIKMGGNTVKDNIKALAVDTTGSTPCPVDTRGIPLAMTEGFEHDPDAMFYLWKDHTSIEEARKVNAAFSDFHGTDYTRYQGSYSSEWYWAKILHCANVNKHVSEKAYTWVEHCDWIPFLLVGGTNPGNMYRCSCAAGHKALWNSAWQGLPSQECLQEIDPYLARIAESYGAAPKPADQCVGTISEEWAERLGLPKDVVIGGSSLDAHAGAVGAGIKRGRMVCSVGTSTVDTLIEKPEILKGKNLVHVCGQAEDSIIPGYIGIETGQAAFGDIFTWLSRFLLWPVEKLDLSDSEKESIKQRLSSELFTILEQVQVSDKEDTVALDWFNGRRYPYADENIKSAIVGITLGTDVADIYRALALGAVFGLKSIVDTIRNGGFAIDEIVAVGGIPKKSPYIMQMMADILGCEIKVSASTQASARGAAIYAAVASGYYKTIPQAQEKLCEGFEKVYRPDMRKSNLYRRLYEKYIKLGRFVDTLE